MIRQRHPINRISTKRRALLDEYAKRRRFFLKEHPWCEWDAAFGLNTPATEIHHSRGRAGSLYLDVRFWKAVSAEGHRMIHELPIKARRLGLLCQPGEWNTPPHTHQ